MAAFNKYYDFVGSLGLKLHNLDTDTIRVILSNTAPDLTDITQADASELSTSGGYTVNGIDAAITYSQTTGVGTAAGTDVVFTATSGFGPFRYAILWNQTANKLIGWWDYGSGVTLAASETFTVDFGASVFTIT